jgi:hypothetical protein
MILMFTRVMTLAALSLLMLWAADVHGAPVESARPSNATTSKVCETSELVTGDVRLEPGCVYHQKLRISTSGTKLDCRGATLDGRGVLGNGVLINSMGKPLANVTVRNCIMRGFTSSGVRVAWSGPDFKKGGYEAAFAGAPSKVTLSHLSVFDSGRVGIFIDDHVHDVTIEDSTIERSGGAGMYLEHGSRDIRVFRNRFLSNGHVFKREGLAIDSSSHNKVIDNVFADNVKGGVFLYKNCGERFSSGRSVVRTQHSDHNEIRGNRFIRERVGVWVASRQSVDLKRLDCSDPSMDPDGHYFEDFANHNDIVGNAFCDTRTGIRIEGDDNRVTDNFFDAKTRQPVDVPVSKRAQFRARPSTRNVIDKSQVVDTLCEYKVTETTAK